MSPLNKYRQIVSRNRPHIHTRETLALAWPLVLTQVGHVVTGMVDNIFLGAIGPTELAAGILSNNLFILVLVFGMGMSFATTPLVTSAHENADPVKKAGLFKSSLLLQMAIAIVCFLLLYNLSDYLRYMKQPADVVALAVPYFDTIALSMIPVTLFFTCKQYCEGISNTRMALLISILGNLLNIILNYGLIYGKLGLPELGYLGSARATLIARTFMGISFLVLMFWSPVTRDLRKAFLRSRILRSDLVSLWTIGINSAMQFTFEVAAFAIAGFMAGNFGKEHIDAHGIALSIAAFTYMFGSGIGSAATIRAGIYKARRDWTGVRNAAAAAVRTVLVVMGGCALVFLVFHNVLPGIFTAEESIVQLASTLLCIAAMFQLFDGLQVTLIGILRGIGDVKVPTLITLAGYWIVALPLAYFLGYTCGLKTTGVWISLLVALLLVALALYRRLWYLVKVNSPEGKFNRLRLLSGLQ